MLNRLNPFSSSEAALGSSRARFSGLLAVDLLMVCLALMGAVSIGPFRTPLPLSGAEFVIGALVIVATTAIFIRQGLYRALINHMGHHAVWDLVRAVTYAASVFGAALFFIDVDIPRSAPLVFWLLLFVTTGGVRMLLRAWYQLSIRRDGSA